MRKIAFIITALIICSCEMTIDVELPEKSPKLVVNSIFDNRLNNFTLNLSKSKSILESENIEFVETAVVKLFENNSLLHQLVYVSNGLYASPSAVEFTTGKTYSIEVIDSNLGTASAFDIMPDSVTVKSVTTRYVESEGKQLFTLIFDEPANTENYYLLSLYERNSEMHENYSIWIESDDPMFELDMFYFNGLFFSDELINGKNVSLNFYSYKGGFYEQKNEYLIDLQSVSKDFYLYLKSLSQHLQTIDAPLSEPVKVHNNIKNGFGIFGAKSHSTIVAITEN